MARDPSGPLGRLPLRGGDGLSAAPGDVVRPRLLPLVGSLAILVVLVWYGLPLATTGDPLWPLPADTRADVITIYWDGRATEVRRSEERYAALMAAVNRALTEVDGIEYRYGMGPDGFERYRASGRALEASYPHPAQAHGAYSIGPFTRLFIALAGEEHEHRLVFVGGPAGYRAGPLRSRDLRPLRDLAEAAAP